MAKSHITPTMFALSPIEKPRCLAAKFAWHSRALVLVRRAETSAPSNARSATRSKLLSRMIR